MLRLMHWLTQSTTSKIPFGTACHVAPHCLITAQAPACAPFVYKSLLEATRSSQLQAMHRKHAAGAHLRRHAALREASVLACLSVPACCARHAATSSQMSLTCAARNARLANHTARCTPAPWNSSRYAQSSQCAMAAPQAAAAANRRRCRQGGRWVQAHGHSRL